MFTDSRAQTGLKLHTHKKTLKDDIPEMSFEKEVNYWQAKERREGPQAVGTALAKARGRNKLEVR